VTVSIRTLQPSDVGAAWALLEQAFGGAPHAEDDEVEHGVVDPCRFYGAYDGDAPVATAGSFAFAMAVPGARLPVAGVTWVGVSPTYRRRGLLSQLMRTQLDDLHEEGRAVAALWASEGAIYARYGYGPAAWMMSVTVPRGAAFRRAVVAERLRAVDPSSPELRDVYDRVAATTPGWPARDEPWWRMRLHDPEHARSGAGPLQAVVADGHGRVEGYALYATEGRWEHGIPAGTVHVREIVTATSDAHARLWRHLLDLDLMTTTTARLCAPDEPLLHLLAEPRAAWPTLRDSLWVRLVDVAPALAARCYAAPLDVVLEVSDDVCPWNARRWRLSGDRTGAVCTPTSDAGDVALDVADLGAAFLGGTPLQTRAAAGGVEERTPGALAVTSTALGPLGRAPWCPLVF
jgi:predicted acetyltransferase